MSALTRKHSFDAVFDGQAVFRLILSALSNPGRTVDVGAYAEKLYGSHPDMLAVAMTLLDNEVGFFCENDALSDEIARLTLSRRADMQSANFLFLLKASELEEGIACAACGTLTHPHRGATLIIRAGGAANAIALSGPGVDGEKTITVASAAITALRLRDEQHYEYPQGIDFLFISEGGELLAIPRTTRWEVL